MLTEIVVLIEGLRQWFSIGIPKGPLAEEFYSPVAQSHQGFLMIVDEETSIRVSNSKLDFNQIYFLITRLLPGPVQKSFTESLAMSIVKFRIVFPDRMGHLMSSLFISSYYNHYVYQL